MKYKTHVVSDLGNLHLIAIGGLDPSGGAGILRDGMTAAALGSSFRAVGTAWAEQSAGHGVEAIDARPLAEVRRAVALALRDAPPGRTAVKVGMTVNSEMLRTIVDALAGFAGPVVFDPVMGATAGGALFDAAGGDVRAAMAPLIARSSVVTPNADEAALLCGRKVVGAADAEWCGHTLLALGAQAVVVKGGHLGTPDVIDVVVTQGQARHLRGARVPGASVRGTGCSYASVLALALAAGASVFDACAHAQAHVAEGIRRAHDVGRERHLGTG